MTVARIRYAWMIALSTHTEQEVIQLTLYVMNTSMRKNDKNTCAPYKAARVIRAVRGSRVLPIKSSARCSHPPYIIQNAGC